MLRHIYLPKRDLQDWIYNIWQGAWDVQAIQFVHHFHYKDLHALCLLRNSILGELCFKLQDLSNNTFKINKLKIKNIYILKKSTLLWSIIALSHVMNLTHLHVLILKLKRKFFTYFIRYIEILKIWGVVTYVRYTIYIYIERERERERMYNIWQGAQGWSCAYFF